MKKRLVLMFLMVLMLITACGKGNKISEDDLKKYGQLSNTAIEYATNGDYKNYIGMCNDTMKNAIDETKFKQVNELINNKGGIVEYGKVEGFYMEDKASKEEQITIIQEVKHEKGKNIYTVSFSKNGQLSGFYVK